MDKWFSLIGSVCLESKGLHAEIKGTRAVTSATSRGCFWGMFNSNFEGYHSHVFYRDVKEFKELLFMSWF